MKKFVKLLQTVNISFGVFLVLAGLAFYNPVFILAGFSFVLFGVIACPFIIKLIDDEG